MKRDRVCDPSPQPLSHKGRAEYSRVGRLAERRIFDGGNSASKRIFCLIGNFAPFFSIAAARRAEEIQSQSRAAVQSSFETHHSVD
jgi:hypothetical protein